MATANQPPPAVVKKIQALAKIAADLRHGKDYNITRLTLIKSLCSDPDAAAKFALNIANWPSRNSRLAVPAIRSRQNGKSMGG